MNEPSHLASVVSAGASQLAVLCLMATAFLMMFGLRKTAGRAMLLAVLMIVVSVMGPAWLPH